MKMKRLGTLFNALFPFPLSLGENGKEREGWRKGINEQETEREKITTHTEQTKRVRAKWKMLFNVPTLLTSLNMCEKEESRKENDRDKERKK